MSAHLSPEEEAAVRDAIGALEIAEGVVPASAFPALREPALRKVVAQRLAACGRMLVSAEQGWVSGYDDQAADALAELGIGMLSPVLLRTVAVPRARGELSGTAWVTQDGARPTSIAELNHNRHLSKKQITESVRKLRTLGLLRPGHRAGILPGPALYRLSSQRAAWLWEDLLMLAAPDSSYARVLRARRTARSALSRPDPQPSSAAASDHTATVSMEDG